MNVELLPQTVTLAKRTGHNATGAPTYGAGTPYKARVQKGNKMVANAQGGQVFSQATIYVEASANLAIEDQLTLPDGSTPRLLQVSASYDGQGVLDHWEVAV